MLFCGFDELEEKSRVSIVEHVRDKNNWARLTKRKAPAKSRPPKKTSNKRMITDGDGGNEEYSDEDILVTTTINKNKVTKNWFFLLILSYILHTNNRKISRILIFQPEVHLLR